MVPDVPLFLDWTRGHEVTHRLPGVVTVEPILPPIRTPDPRPHWASLVLPAIVVIGAVAGVAMATAYRPLRPRASSDRRRPQDVVRVPLELPEGLEPALGDELALHVIGR